jgi:hypothetical protein
MQIQGRVIRSIARAGKKIAVIAVPAAMALTALAAMTLPAQSASASSPFINWPSYLDGVTHQSHAAGATAITQSNASELMGHPVEV